jgi:Flp pilus assembly protein TadG
VGLAAPTLFRRARQRGQTLVETALVLPMLMLLVFGIVELAHAASVMQTLDNAARDGAQWSARPTEGTGSLPLVSAVQTRVVADAAAAGVPITPFAVSVNQEIDQTVNGIVTSYSQVQVKYHYTFITPMLAAILPGVTITGKAIMRNETN